MPRPGIALNKHIIRNDAQADLCSPHPGPDRGIIVDMGQERPLTADDRAGRAQTPDGCPDLRLLQFSPVIVVGHEGDVLAGGDEFLTQAHEVVGIRIARKAEGPVGQRLRADPNGLDVLELGLNQGPQVFGQVMGLHDHRVSAGHEQVAHLRLCGQIAMQLTGVVGIKP